MSNTILTDAGAVVISTTAIAQLAYKAVSECFGVVECPRKILPSSFVVKAVTRA